MPIPDFQSVFLPLLRYCADGKVHSKIDVVPALAAEFQLTDAELGMKLPSGKQGLFDNRVGWAKSYLKQSGLLEIVSRGLFKITQRGMGVLNESPAALNIKYLKQFSEFAAFYQGAKLDKADGITGITQPNGATPDELVSAGYKQLRESLVTELQERVKTISPSRFEGLVVELLVKMGYGGTQEDAGRVVGKSGDGGIDGIINEDRLGLDVIYIQAKRWEGDVGRPEVQKFVGALAGHKAKKGVFLTTSSYTKEARVYASQVDSKIVLINGTMLAELMIDFNLGVSTKEIYEVKRLDTDYFEEE